MKMSLNRFSFQFRISYFDVAGWVCKRRALTGEGALIRHGAFWFWHKRQRTSMNSNRNFDTTKVDDTGSPID